MKPLFFREQSNFRQWLEEHHETDIEQWVGFYKKGSNRPSITWPQSVDEALCYGWIDGLRKTIDEESYMIRFTPRRVKSNWSQVNLKKMVQLKAKGLVKSAGLAIYNQRDHKKYSILTSDEQKAVLFLAPLLEAQFQANSEAWTFFKKQPPSYRKQMVLWVTSAKREDTRQRRLLKLIEGSEQETRLR